MAWFNSKNKEILPEIPPIRTSNMASTSSSNEIPPMNFQNNSNFNEGLMYPQFSESVPYSMDSSIKTKSVKEGGDPFFVRIDKFDGAKKSIVEIDKKLEYMDSLLGKLDTLKQKEEEEISSWKKSVTEVKGYMEEINNFIFNYI